MVFAPKENEQQLIEKLRESLSEAKGWTDLEYDAYILHRLKAMNMDFEKTRISLLETYKYRVDHGMDTILQDYIPDPELVKICAYVHCGYDKENCPVFCGDVPAINPRKVIKKYGKEALFRFGEYNIEKVAQICRDKTTKEIPVQQVVAIIDAKKFTYKQMTSPGVTELAWEGGKLVEAHLPNTLKLAVVVNAPKVAKLAYKLVKPFIPEEELKKVKIFPKCNAKVKKFLLQYIDADELPEKYGGNKKIGGEVDARQLNDEEDISGNPEDLEGDEDLIEAKVGAGKKLKLVYQIDQPKTQICWSFQTEDREIGFTVYLGEKEETIVPYGKFGSLALQNNSIICEKPGKYTLCFNNKENRFRSVTLNYIVSVFPPGNDDDDEE